MNTTLSQAQTELAIGEYWDEHDLGDVWEQTAPAAFTLRSHSSTTYYPVERELSQKLHALAQARGVSAETLVNLWLQEKARDAA